MTTRKSAFLLYVILTILTTSTPVSFGEGRPESEVFTIGIVNTSLNHVAAVNGFKTGMAELGYVEGKNIKYIYNSVIEPQIPVIDQEIRLLLSRDIDLLLAVANEAAVAAKIRTQGAGIPVLAAACMSMGKTGLVKSKKQPAGNLTGVQVTTTASKALEWLTIAVPGVKRIYLPYNPYESISSMVLPDLKKAATQLGVELVFHKVQRADDAIAVIKESSKDIDAVFRIPSHILGQAHTRINQAAISRKLPVGAAMPTEKEALLTFGSAPFEIGIQTARLAHQIRKGLNPSDLPVETAEVFLTINLDTAEKIGFTVPHNILLFADRVIR